MESAFELEACRRLPLADAALRLLDFATDDAFLQGVFARHRGRSYESAIAFPTFVHLVADALLGHRGPSAHQAFQHARDDESLETTVQAMYGKLRRVPLELSLGLLAESATRLRSVASGSVAHPLPKSFDAFWCLGFDGKKIKYVAGRLKPLRGLKGEIYGGKLLVVQDLATQQAVAAEAVADGEAGDSPLAPGAVARVRALGGSRPRLWVGDRAFCDYKLLGLLAADADGFVVRFNTACGFHADPDVPPRAGIDDEKRPYREEWGWLGGPKHPHRIRVRRIAVDRPGDPLIFVTGLLDADRYPAADVLTLYRGRWGIETMFQRVVQTFDLRHLIGTTPQATVLQAVLCLLLYNATLIVRDYVALGAGEDPEAVSLDLLFDATRRDLTAWMEVIGGPATLELIAATRIRTADDLRTHLRVLLGAVWTERWRKSPTRTRPPARPKRAYLCGGHSSVDKILRGTHNEIPFKPKRAKAKPEESPPFETKKHV